MVHELLVPIDLGDHSEHALGYACELAGALDARVHLVSVVDMPLPELTVTLSSETFEALRRERGEAVRELAGRYPGTRFGTIVVKDGDARDAILETADEVGADLIVMGTHGRRGIKRMLLGSVAENVVRRAHIPVLTVRAKLDEHQHAA